MTLFYRLFMMTCPWIRIKSLSAIKRVKPRQVLLAKGNWRMDYGDWFVLDFIANEMENQDTFSELIDSLAEHFIQFQPSVA